MVGQLRIDVLVKELFALREEWGGRYTFHDTLLTGVKTNKKVGNGLRDNLKKCLDFFNSSMYSVVFWLFSSLQQLSENSIDTVCS